MRISLLTQAISMNALKEGTFKSHKGTIIRVLKKKPNQTEVDDIFHMIDGVYVGMISKNRTVDEFDSFKRVSSNEASQKQEQQKMGPGVQELEMKIKSHAWDDFYKGISSMMNKMTDSKKSGELEPSESMILDVISGVFNKMEEAKSNAKSFYNE